MRESLLKSEWKSSPLIVVGFLYTLSALIGMCTSYQLTSSDVTMNYSNARYMTEISFKFEVITPLATSDYVKIVLPFPLHSSLMIDVDAPSTMQRPFALTATWTSITGTTESTPKSTQIFCLSVNSSQYFLQFLSDVHIIQPLAAGWYRITFTIGDTTALSAQKEQQLLQIQLFTVSSTTSTAVIRDENQAHSFLYLDAKPLSDLSIAITFSSETTKKTINSSQTVFFDISIDSSIIDSLGNKRFVISLTDKSFLFFGTCTSATKTSLPIIPMLQSADYTCSIDTTRNEVHIIMNVSGLTKQTVYRFSVSISNPSFVISGVGVNVVALQEFSSTIIQQGSLSSVFETNPLSISSFDMDLAWGIVDPVIPMNLYITRGSGPTDPGYMPYNQINLRFQMAINTPSSVEQRVIINIKTDASSLLLAGSIIHNLPSFSNRDVTCRELDAAFPDSRRIVCSQVGVLDKTVKYFISFKMYFYFDIYEAPIKCEEFGTLQIQSMNHISASDDVIAISRDVKYINSMRDNYGASVTDTANKADILAAMKSYPSLVLLVNAQDFPDYLEEVYATSRPIGFAGKFDAFYDYFVPASSVKFLNYMIDNLATKPNVFIAQFPKKSTFSPSAITKSASSYYTLPKTSPRNVKTIPTKNGNNMMDTTHDVQASTISSTFDLTKGIAFGSSQSLSLFLKGTYGQVTKNTYASSGNPALTNSVGLLLMMNPLITFTGTPALSPVLASATLSTSSLTSYTLAKIAFAYQTPLKTFFPQTAASSVITMTGFTLSQFSSTNTGIETNLDFFIQTIDGINGPTNNQVRNAFVLINGYSLSPTSLSTLNVVLTNYWSTSSNGNDGSMLPALLTIRGNIPSSPPEKLVVFFENLIPFYFNENQNLVSCGSNIATLQQPECKAYTSGTTDYKTYWRMNRIEITLGSADLTTQFEIVIPISIGANQSSFNIMIASMTAKKAIILARSITAFSFTVQGSTLASPLTGSTSSQDYQISCASCLVGATGSSTQINASHTGGSIAVNSGSNIGAGFTYVADYPFFFSSSTVSSATTFVASTCVLFSYKYDANSRYGVFCPYSSASGTPSITLSSLLLPSKQESISYGGYSTNTGLLTTLISSTFSFLQATSITTPLVVPMIQSSQTATIISLEFISPLDLPSSFRIRQDLHSTCLSQFKLNLRLSTASNFPITRQTYEKCSFLFGASSVFQGATCVLANTASLNSLDFDITITKGRITKLQTLKVSHYGLTTSATGSDTTGVTLSILDSTAATEYAKIASLTVTYSSLTVPATLLGVKATTFSVLSLSQSSTNQQSLSILAFDFQLSSKSLMQGEKVHVAFGGFSTLNLPGKSSLSCSVFYKNPDPTAATVALEDRVLSKDVDSIVFSESPVGVLGLDINFNSAGFASERIYSVECNYFIVPPTTGATITFQLFGLSSSQLFSDITKVSETPVAALASLSTSSKVVKSFGSPGSSMEIVFELYTSASVVNSSSRILLIFPSYYSPQLSRDNENLVCLQGTLLLEITCTISRSRVLEIKNFRESVSAGSKLRILISGVTQPLNYSVGFFKILVDASITTALTFDEYIQIRDTAIKQTQSFLSGSLFVQKAVVSSLYLLTNKASYSFRIKLTNSMTSIAAGQYIIVNFPSIFVKQFRSQSSPSCSISQVGTSSKEFSGQCTSLGLRVKIRVNELMPRNSFYDIVVSNLYNPPGFGPQSYKWIIEITDSDQVFMLYRSFASTSNYADPIFSVDPAQNILGFSDSTGTSINRLSLIKGVISQPIFIKISSSSTQIYARSFSLMSMNSLIQTAPLKPNMIVGTKVNSIQFYSSTALGVYEMQLEKQGDGDFYANLPTLKIEFDPKNKQTIGFVQNPIPAGISSSFVYLTLNCLLPIDYIDVTFSFPTGYDTKGFSLNPSASTVRFTNSISIVKLTYTLLASAVADTVIEILAAVSGTNADAYQYLSTSPIQIKFIASTGTNPTVNLAIASQPVLTPTIVNLNIGCNIQATIFWGISRKHSADSSLCTLTKDTVLSKVTDTTMNTLRPCQYQFGSTIVLDSTTVNVSISKLRVSTAYRVYAVCVDNQGLEAFSSTPLSLTTLSNGGSLKKIVIDFDKTPPTDQQNQAITCFLTLFFMTQPTNIRTGEGVHCQEMVEQTNWRRRMLSSAATTLSCAQEISDIALISSDVMFSETYYFSQNMEIDVDALSGEIYKATRQKCFKTTLVSQLSGLIPSVLNIHTAEDVASSVPTSTSNPSIKLGQTWAYVYGFSFGSNSMLYSVLTLDSDASPTELQIIQGLNNAGEFALASSPLVYRVGQKYDTNMTYVPLSTTQKYKLYYIYGNESPFPDQYVYSQPQSISIDMTTVLISSSNTLAAIVLLVFGFILY